MDCVTSSASYGTFSFYYFPYPNFTSMALQFDPTGNSGKALYASLYFCTNSSSSSSSTVNATCSDFGLSLY